MKRSTTPTPLKKHILASPEQEKLLQKRRRSRQRLVTVLSVSAVVLLVGVVFASRIPRILITTVVVKGNQIVDTDEIVSRVNADIAGNYAYIIPRSNAFLYPKKEILADLAEAFPRLRNISVSRSGFRTLTVTVTEEHGVALWCGSQVDPIDLQAPCYFTDDHGLIIDTAPHYSGNVYPRFYGGILSGIDQTQPLGETFVPEDLYHKLLDFHSQVHSLGFSIQAMRIGPGEEYAFVLDVGQGKTALLRFRSGDDYGILLSNFKAALGKQELSDSLAKDKVNLEYFDLRFTNKVYYKFSDQGSSEPMATTPTANTD